MTISIESLSSCPHCQTDLTPDPRSDLIIDKDSCWNCGRKLKNPANKHFECPDYLFHQKNSLIEELERGKLKPGDTRYEEKIQEIQKDLVTWVRECTTEDKIAPLYDSVVILENLLFTTTPAADLKAVISMAKKVGMLANALEQYFKAGGASYDRKTRPIRPDTGEASWDQATATASWNT